MITSIDQLDFSKQYTYADYLTWKFDERVELIRGWISRMSPAPLVNHQRVSIKFAAQIVNFLEGKKCDVFVAPFDVRLTNKRKKVANNSIQSVVQPDICVICDETKLDKRGCIGAPDWVIEILSPGNSKNEMQEKFSLYEENGVREYWIVIPMHFAVQVFDLVNDKFTFRSFYNKGDMIPVGIFDDFAIDSKKIFS